MSEQRHARSDTLKEPLLAVTVPVADLWIEPPEKDAAGGQDIGRQTQVLMNEPLQYLAEQEGWYRVEAPEQQKLTAGDWGGYPGWIRRDCAAFIQGLPVLNGIVARGTVAAQDASSPATDLFLCAGTKVSLTGERKGDLARIELPAGSKGWVRSTDIFEAGVPKSPAGMRHRILETAMSFVGTPYLWGGRSTHLPSVRNQKTAGATGVDCSGLVNLSYRVAGIDIPRDARDQRAAARPVSPRDLEAGDLIFLSTGDGPDRIDHVMLFLGDERFIEAARTGRFVEVGTFLARFGQTLGDIADRNPLSESRKIYYGSFAGKEQIGADHLLTLTERIGGHAWRTIK